MTDAAGKQLSSEELNRCTIQGGVQQAGFNESVAAVVLKLPQHFVLVPTARWNRGNARTKTTTKASQSRCPSSILNRILAAARLESRYALSEARMASAAARGWGAA